MKAFKTISRTLLAAAVVLMLAAIPAAAASEGSFQRTLTVSGPVNLDISTGSGSITVRSGASNQVQVTGRIRISTWFVDSDDSDARVKRIEANPPILQSGNDIRIGYIDDPDLRRNVSISYEVIVPAATRLQAHTGSGSQQVDGIQGPAEISTGSGSIRASDVGDTLRAGTGSGSITIDHVQGNVHAKTGSGSINATGVGGGFEGSTGSGHVTLEQTSPGAVRIDTGSGGMELRGLRGSLEAKAGSGSIRAEGKPTGSWMLHTGSGGIHLKFASDAAFDLYAHTGSGSLNVTSPVTVQGSLGRHEIRGQVRGGGVQVEAETGSGTIDIE